MELKLCGIQTSDIANHIAAHDVSYIGYIIECPRSVRTIDRKQARDLVRFVRQQQPQSQTKHVGVLVDQMIEEAEEIFSLCELDAVQLHGMISLQRCKYLRHVGVVHWKSFSLQNEQEIEQLQPYIPISDVILLDSQGKNGQSGGTGEIFDWTLARKARERVPKLCLSGGINAENFQHAVDVVEPDIIDLSSGIEKIRGIKDPHRIDEIVHLWKSNIKS